MSLLELIVRADERGLAASGVACLDRCVPLLADEGEVLRPLWSGLADGEQTWASRLAAAREAMESAVITDETATLVRKMLAAAPSDWAAEPLRAWSDSCSVVALEIHQQFDVVGDRPIDTPDSGGPYGAWVERCRAGAAGDAEANPGIGPFVAGPLVSGELRRQIQILQILSDTAGTAGLRQALDVSTEGRRVLRAVVSRRARAQG
ncbi:hypothetical protein ACIBLA_01220 [Streptomyces sp. NPDC050433]|uniref:hypothetical protein n=1 Tax=Streptomyces sp. NPDC050433 TaxID=3365615 RepID=UPI0037AC984C